MLEEIIIEGKERERERDIKLIQKIIGEKFSNLGKEMDIRSRNTIDF